MESATSSPARECRRRAVGKRAPAGRARRTVWRGALDAALGCCLILVALTGGRSSWATTPFANADQAVTPYRDTELEAARTCRSMIATSDYRHTILAAREIPASQNVPAHCRLSGLIPTEVRFELNLPKRWNGRIYMMGNGGLAGGPASGAGPSSGRDRALAHGFATVYTDTGHDRRVHPGGTFAHDNFHRLVDYGFRAVHLTIMSAKELSKGYYGESHRYAYWDGCSTGGRQALISAQRFPEDFDGIIAGAPAADYSGLKLSQAWRVQAIQQGGFTPAEVSDLANRIYARCDGLDGLEDGLIADPRQCPFDPEQDLPRCRGRDKVDCYTKDEVAALVRYYAPVQLAGQIVYPGFPVGSEVGVPDAAGALVPGWVPWLINEDGPTLLELLGADFFRYMAFVPDRPTFDWTEFDFATVPDNLAEFRAIVDAIDPDLRTFRDRGGKVLSYFGWADPDINPLTVLHYRDQVKLLDAQADDYFRVFMVPGLFHCRGGPGPDRFDLMSPLIDWVEQGRAPNRIRAWRARNPTGPGAEVLSRPLCAYPKHAAHDGFGDPRRADSFVCR